MIKMFKSPDAEKLFKGERVAKFANIASVAVRKLQQVRAIARFAAFDTATERGRSDERHRRIFLTAAASALAVVSIWKVMLSAKIG